jgi:heme exporter protein D
MEPIITMITVAVAIAFLWAVFIYITEIRKDRKILDDYINKKHRRNKRFKNPASARQTPVPSE